MSGNNRPLDLTCGTSETAEGMQLSNTNDVVDLTETNDSHESTVSSSTRNIGDSSAKAPLESVDDSICILYENIQPSPEVVVVNEIIIENPPDEIDIVPPVRSPVFEVYYEYREPVIEQIPPLFPDLSSDRIHSAYQPINYSLTRAPLPTRPSCKYATTNERPNQQASEALPTIFPGIRDLVQGEPLKAVTTGTSPEKENTNNVTKVAKIECGICMDGPDEIAASGRNFTSTNCGHVFCNICIKTSMRNAAKCPKCRKKITSRSIHPLYF